MDDVISRRVAIDAVETIGHIATMPDGDKCIRRSAVKYTLSMLPSAQPERTVYENMSDEQFEEWLYEHGICNPDIHESIPCSVVPLLIDNAINELLPQEHTQEHTETHACDTISRRDAIDDENSAYNI